jgi:hypothetical protein
MRQRPALLKVLTVYANFIDDEEAVINALGQLSSDSSDGDVAH